MPSHSQISHRSPQKSVSIKYQLQWGGGNFNKFLWARSWSLYFIEKSRLRRIICIYPKSLIKTTLFSLAIHPNENKIMHLCKRIKILTRESKRCERDESLQIPAIQTSSIPYTDFLSLHSKLRVIRSHLSWLCLLHRLHKLIIV